MTRSPAVRRLALAILVAAGAGAGCRAGAAPTILQVALRSADVARSGLPATIVPGDTLALVRMEAAGGAGATLAPTAAAGVVEALRRDLAAGARPAVSPIARLALPTPPAALHGVLLDVLLFHDANGDRRWNAGESYMSAWTGGRGTYRLVYLAGPRAGQPDARAGWNLVEGGEPPAYHHDFGQRVVYIDPVVRAVPRS